MGSTNLHTLVTGYLRGLVMAGTQRLAVEEDVRPCLRRWLLAARAGRKASPAFSVDGVRGYVTSSAKSAADAPIQQHPDIQESVAAIRALSEEIDAGTARECRAGWETEMYFRPAGKTRTERFEQAKKLLLRWEPLCSLNTLRRTPVWGSGDLDADIMFVGDAPGFYDEEKGRPFSGEAGEKLDEILSAMGLSRDTIYLTHMVKFRPAVPRQTFNNRLPNARELELSRPVVDFEVRLVQPKVIVALGVVPARGMLAQGDYPLSYYQQMRDARFCDVPVVVTHHPGYLLRTGELGERRRLWEEMLRALEIAHLPVTARQRSFFLPKK